ncbi:hypothetical protein GCM10023200_32950 [Actinomycetospora chlora]|uniref:Uncharacterized protein n=1 Tax=Actinomycetospora chlora TaxID=663608 RepID=A0ABP9BEL8_9PSEU
MQSQRGPERLLGPALVRGEQAEHPDVPRVQAEGRETVGEAPVPVRAELGHQEAGPAVESRCGDAVLPRLFVL